MTTDPLLVSLAQEYIHIVDHLHHGEIRHTVRDDMSAERSVLHEQLLAALGKTREEVPDMVTLARQIVAEVRR